MIPMKPTPTPPRGFALLACSTLLSFAGVPSAQDSAPPAAPPTDGGLRRVDPSQEEDPRGLRDLLSRDFDRDRWEERLTQPDLDQRERSLDALLKRARFDPVARAFLEEHAMDPQGGELAWTARLALRELGRASFPMQGFFPGADPLGSAQRMQEWMEELFGRDGFGLMVPHPSLPLPGRQGTRGSGRSVQVEQNERGARVLVTETVDGTQQTREYEGGSIEEILQANPELERELDGLRIHVQPGSPLDLRFDLGNRLDRNGRLSPGQLLLEPRLAPQGRSRPILTDRLGVIVQPLSAERARELGLVGVGLVVERSVPETYAHLLGVGAGDVLVELDGTALRSAADIERVMRARAADDELRLVWLDQLGQRQEKTWKPAPAAEKR
jgi:hypothetical protein